MQQRRFEEPFGKVHPVLSADGKRVLLPAEERAVCNVCRKRRHSTVNGVCSTCLEAKHKHVH